jgi:hypothetical protein
MGGAIKVIIDTSHYKVIFGAENNDIGLENPYFWDV